MKKQITFILLMIILAFFNVGCALEKSDTSSSDTNAKSNILIENSLGDKEGHIEDYFYNFENNIDASFFRYSPNLMANYDSYSDYYSCSELVSYSVSDY